MKQKRKDTIDVLLGFIERNMPETICLTRNPDRYGKIVQDMQNIQDFFSEDQDATFKVSKDALLGDMLCLEVSCALLAVTDVTKFANVIKEADTIDIEASTDGTISLVFGFKDAYIPYIPKD